MSLPINEVVNVQLLPSARSAARRDFSMAVLMTDEVGDAFLDGTTRFVMANSPDDVANLFGTDSEVYKAAQQLFSTQPRLSRAMVGRWVRTAQDIPATANQIKGSTLTLDINMLKEVNNGSFALTIGGVLKEYAGIDLSTAVDMADVAEIISHKMTNDGVVCVYDGVGSRFIIKSKTEGEDGATKLGYTADLQNGTYIGQMLRLEDGLATLINGADEITVPKETTVKALTLLQNETQNFYGIYFAKALTDGELDTAHSWVASSTSSKVLAYTAIREDQIEWDNASIIKKLFDKNSGRLMVQYNNTGDAHAGAALLAEAISTNWNGASTAKTVKFKQQTLTRSDDRITLTEAAKCRRLGVNFYTDYDSVPMLAEGVMLGGRFIDEVTGLDAFVDACQKQAFATLQGAATKIPQTDRGQERIIAGLKVVGNEFNRNGFLGGGLWGGADIGDLAYGDRLDEGYYFYSDSYDTQTTPDREARKGMPVNTAIKLAGAIHSLDIIVQFNR